MLEKDFEAQVKELAQKIYGYSYYHTYRSKRSPEGFPDCVIVGYGTVIYAELKSDTGQCTAEQYEWLLALIEAGQEVYLWRPDDLQDIADILAARREDGIERLRGYLDGKNRGAVLGDSRG